MSTDRWINKEVVVHIHKGTFSLVQFSSVAPSCQTLCNPMNHSMPGLPVHHQLLEFTQTHVHRVGDAIQPSHPVIPFSSCPQSLPASGSFPMSQLFAWGGQSIGVSALASLLSHKKRNTFELVLMRWMNLEIIIQSKVSWKEKDKYRILTHMYGI